MKTLPRVFVLLSLPLLFALGACKEEKAEAAPPRAVLAFEVASETLGGGRFYSGEVRPWVELPLAFRIPGKLSERLVEVGELVRAGQVIARLDPADPRLNAQAARNALAGAQAELELARAEVTRFEALRAQGFVSQAALDARITAAKAAENRTQAAKAQAETAGNQADYAVLKAEFAGVVSAVSAEAGQVLAAGQPVLRVARTGGRDKEVQIALAENRVSDLQPGRTVAVRLWADQVRQYRGVVREISPIADPVTRTFAARITLTDADSAVRFGMTATVVAGGTASGIVKIPSAAIVQKDGKPAVWVLGPVAVGGRADTTLRPVGVSAFREDGVVLSSGLRPGERIVAAGGHKLMPGEPVRVLEGR